MPAPWVQLKLLQILAVLGASDKNASEGMYEILREVMKRADIGINVGYAIVYECVRTVTSIYPDPALIEDAASSISRFITSDNHNLKYLGVNALAAIVQIDSKYAAEHQLVVVNSLEDPDETLKRKTLDLLCQLQLHGGRRRRRHLHRLSVYRPWAWGVLLIALAFLCPPAFLFPRVSLPHFLSLSPFVPQSK